MDSITAAGLAMIGASIGAAALTAAGVTVGLWLPWFAVRRWAPRRVRESASALSMIPLGLCVFILALPFSCMWALRPAPQLASMRLVRVMEVPLRAQTDRADFIDLFRRQAANEGMVFVDASESWRQAPPDLRRTLYVALDRPTRRKQEWEITAFDDGPGTEPWVRFYRGVEPVRASASRGRLIAALKARFPDTLEVPFFPPGTTPHREDLQRVGAAYRIRADRAAAYEADSKNAK